MDNGLVQKKMKGTGNEISVLILVVVDNGLVQLKKIMQGTSKEVLILVVVDNGLVPLVENSEFAVSLS